ncbi:V-type ATP synthase subunit E [Ruminococcaceae bacterium OttesenSCG-928-A16]|nr:V-type ATP synthase subunit E [Ruminococcaceae bacterium OttesenSCG-928-A16]
MSGLEKILQEIQQEADTESAALLLRAKTEADEMVAAAESAADVKAAEIAETAAQDVKNIQQAQQSAMQLQRRQRTLAVKQQLLAETLEKARQALLQLPTDEYFELLLVLAGKAAQPGSGEMLLNEHDHARLPAFFKLKLAAEALPKGAILLVSSSTRPIDGGFVLKYGDIEENCSFEAMFNARRDEFVDLIQQTLFA